MRPLHVSACRLGGAACYGLPLELPGVAQLKTPSRPRDGDLWPALRDVQLLWVAPQAMTLAGFERI